MENNLNVNKIKSLLNQKAELEKAINLQKVEIDTLTKAKKKNDGALDKVLDMLREEFPVDSPKQEFDGISMYWQDFTHLEVENLEFLPEEFKKIKVEPDKKLISAALELSTTPPEIIALLKLAGAQNVSEPKLQFRK